MTHVMDQLPDTLTGTGEGPSSNRCRFESEPLCLHLGRHRRVCGEPPAFPGSIRELVHDNGFCHVELPVFSLFSLYSHTSHHCVEPRAHEV